MSIIASKVSDQELIKEYLNGNENCLELLINKHRQKVFSYIMMLVKDSASADDIFQDTFIKVINTLKSGLYLEEGKFIQWVMRIAHNLIIDYFRKNKKVQFVQPFDEDYDIFETISEQESSIEEKMIVDQIHCDIRKLIDFLPSEQKEVLILRHYDDLSFKDIATLTNVSINTALGRMRYALINLRKLIQENQIELTV